MRRQLLHCLLVFTCLLPVACRNDEADQTESASTAYERSLDKNGVELAENVAQALREAGVCSLKVYKGTYGGRTINSSDDVFTQFMLIANEESALGRPDGLSGLGGAGMFGTKLSHFSDALQAKDPDNGKLYGCNRGGLDNERLMKDHLRNAKCAFALYLRRSGFGAWGPEDDSWGSNGKIRKWSPVLISQLTRKCGYPACAQSTVKWNGNPSILPKEPGSQQNVFTVNIPKDCPAKKVAVKLFTSSKAENPSDEWVEEIPYGSKKATVDLLHLKKRNPNIKYKVAVVQVKDGGGILATLKLIELPFFHD